MLLKHHLQRKGGNIRWHIVKPYVTRIQEEMGSPDQLALLIMDKFKGQMSAEVQENLEENKIHVVDVPVGTTDKLQPHDLSIKKAAKSFLHDRFHHWYANEVKKKLQTLLR